MRIKQTSHQAQELEFLQTARNIAHVLAKEIESIEFIIQNTKEENCFVKNTQGIFRRNWNTCVLFGIMKK